MFLRLLCLVALLLVTQFPVAAEDHFTDAKAIKAFLNDNFGHTNFGMVIGLVDEHGSRIFGAGKLDNGASEEVNGDTVFEIGSITKTFTSLLLMDMVERGEMKLDDPVMKYLPGTAKVPARNGKEITLLQLATHTSGLPFNPDNLLKVGDDGENPWAGYNAGKMYAFLSRHQLRREPGSKYEYSNFGVALLGHVISSKEGTNYEALVLERICRPLGMNNTRVTITPELKSRLATGHRPNGTISPNWDLDSAVAAGGLHSTVNDLLKFVSANVGLGQSHLTQVMEKTHLIRYKDSPGLVAGEMHGNTGMSWMDNAVYQPAGMELLGHAGGTGGYSTFIGFDKKQRRGVVVLSNQRNIHSSSVGWRVLQNARLNGIEPTKMLPVREMTGTGVALDLDKETHLIKISKVYPESFAAKAGLSADMIIQKIEGVSTLNKSLAEGLTLFRANGAPKVQLEVSDPHMKVTNTVELARGKFLVEQ